MLVPIFAASLFTALFQSTPDGVEVNADPTGKAISLKTVTQTYCISNDAGVQFYIDLKDEIFDTGKSIYSCRGKCGLECRGKKFDSHKQCDNSCDKACTQIHQGALRAWESDSKLDRAQTQLQADLKKFGGPDSLIKGFPWKDSWVPKREDDLYTYKLRHWVNDPCSQSLLEAEYEVYQEDLTYKLWRKENGATVDGPTHTETIDRLQVPTGKMIEAKPFVRCICDINSPREMWYGGYYNPYNWQPSPGTTTPPQEKKDTNNPPAPPAGSGVKIGLAPDSRVGAIQDFAAMNVSFTCPDVITANISSGGWKGDPDGLLIEPGTILEPDDDEYQSMIVLDEMKLLRDSDVVVPVDPTKPKIVYIGRQPKLTGVLNVVGYANCLEMHKKQPDSSVKYHEILSNDLSLDRLAWAASHELIRGPWVQTRFWIVTDNATYDEVANVLLPAPSKQKYVEALYTVATVGGIDFPYASQKRCLDVHQLSWGEPSDAAIHWLVRTLCEIDPKAVADYVEKNPKDFDYLFDPDIEEGDYAYIAELANALCTEDDPRVRQAGRDFLKRVPENMRSGVARHGGLLALNGMIMSDDAKVVEDALSIAETYKDPSIKLSLMNINASMPDDVKSQAADLLKSLH